MHIVTSQQVITFGIVAAELSGDMLGAQLIAQLKIRYPQARFVGIGGEQMRAHDQFTCLYDMNEITAIGVTQVLRIYFRARTIFKELVHAFTTTEKIDCFIAIDAPMFNMPLARRLKPTMPTILYVSPAYWSFGRKRLFHVMESFSAVLCIYPFEVSDYTQHNFPAYYVGHPVLQQDALQLTTNEAREQLALTLPEDTKLVCCFLGSRTREIRTHAPHIARLLDHLRQTKTGKWHYLIALPETMKSVFTPFEHLFAADDTSIVYGNSAVCLSACDLALLKSGTSTLEATVAEKPMVIYYYAPWVTRVIFRLLGGKFFGLPNFLCAQPLVPELVSPTTTQLADALAALANKEQYRQQQQALKTAHTRMQHTATAPDEAIVMILNH